MSKKKVDTSIEVIFPLAHQEITDLLSNPDLLAIEFKFDRDSGKLKVKALLDSDPLRITVSEYDDTGLISNEIKTVPHHKDYGTGPAYEALEEVTMELFE